MAQPLTVYPASNLPAAIDSYVEKVVDRFAATVRMQLPQLQEPNARVPTDRALRFCGYVVETLAGFARGAALASIHAMARKFGVPSAELDRERLIDDQHAPPLALVGRAIPDADRRPLVDVLGTHLHQRLAFDVYVIRAHARRLLRSVTDPARTIAALEIAACDTAPALRLADQIEHAWATLHAALFEAPAPAIEHARSRDLWHGWLRTVRGEPAREAAVTEWIVQIG